MHPLLKENKCVKQETEHGCVIANLATILGLSYAEVDKCFSMDFDKELGISSKQAADFLAGFGFTAIWKAAEYYNSYRFVNEELLKPFAEIHLVSIQQYSDKPDYVHSLLMTKEGLLLEPATGEMFNKEFLCVNSTFGFWYPSNWSGKPL